MERHEVDLNQLQLNALAAAQRAQDQSIGDRANYLAHAMQFVKMLGVIEFIARLREDGATLTVSRKLARELGLIQEAKDEGAA